MPRRPYVLAAGVLALLLFSAGVGLSHGVSHHVAHVEDALDARLAVIPADDPATPWLTKASRMLARPANERSLAAEIGGVAKAERFVLRGAAGETEVLAGFEVARTGYRDDLTAARGRVAAALTAQGLPRRTSRSLTRLDAALATLPDTFSGLSRSAQKARGWTAYDSGASYAFVVGTLTVAPAGQGFDLDGDRRIDNGVAELEDVINLISGTTLDAIVASSLSQGDSVLLLEVFHAGPLQRDRLAFAGFLAGTDTDADPSDNLSGTETFAVDPALLGADGHAVQRAATSIRRGTLRARLDGAALPLAGGADGLVVLTATLGETSASGRLGAAIPTDALIDALAAAGAPVPAMYLPAVRSAADLDLDGDGSDDAFSIAFDFTAAPATFVAAP